MRGLLNSELVWDPKRYFLAVAEPIKDQLRVAREELLEQEVDAVLSESLPDLWSADADNPLMELFKLKFDESAYLFHHTSLGMQGQMDDTVV